MPERDWVRFKSMDRAGHLTCGDWPWGSQGLFPVGAVEGLIVLSDAPEQAVGKRAPLTWDDGCLQLKKHLREYLPGAGPVLVRCYSPHRVALLSAQAAGPAVDRFIRRQAHRHGW